MEQREKLSPEEARNKINNILSGKEPMKIIKPIELKEKVSSPEDLQERIKNIKVFVRDKNKLHFSSSTWN